MFSQHPYFLEVAKWRYSAGSLGALAVPLHICRPCSGTKHLSRRFHEEAEGFLLIELLIVVAIILIIAAIAIPNLMRSRMAANGPWQSARFAPSTRRKCRMPRPSRIPAILWTPHEPRRRLP